MGTTPQQACGAAPPRPQVQAALPPQLPPSRTTHENQLCSPVDVSTPPSSRPPGCGAKATSEEACPNLGSHSTAGQAALGGEPILTQTPARLAYLQTALFLQAQHETQSAFQHSPADPNLGPPGPRARPAAPCSPVGDSALCLQGRSNHPSWVSLVPGRSGNSGLGGDCTSLLWRGSESIYLLFACCFIGLAELRTVGRLWEPLTLRFSTPGRGWRWHKRAQRVWSLSAVDNSAAPEHSGPSWRTLSL